MNVTLNGLTAIQFTGTDGSALTILEWIENNTVSSSIKNNPIQSFKLNGVNIMEGSWLIKLPDGTLLISA